MKKVWMMLAAVVSSLMTSVSGFSLCAVAYAAEAPKPAKAVKVVQTAGRDNLGRFAPDFARYNDDILFGEVWSGPPLWAWASLTAPSSTISRTPKRTA